MPLMKQSTVVPFGKHKGEPMEQLAADPEYCEWLMGQSWFVEKYAHIHTLIINNFGEPNETPEHNRLQLRFLDETFRRQCMQAAGVAKGFYAEQPMPAFEVGGVDVQWAMMRWRLDVNQREYTEETPFSKQYTALKGEATQAGYRYEEHERTIQYAPQNCKNFLDRIAKLDDLKRRNQPGGWDHARDTDECRRNIEREQHALKIAQEQIGERKAQLDVCVAARDWHRQEYQIVFTNTVNRTIYEWEPENLGFIGIECKPVLGDDYPAVLRFMRNIRQRPSLYCLVIGALRSQAASMDQLRLVFAQANILLLSVPEIEAAVPMPAWAHDELPNPLEDATFIAA